jgi:hypothetical protein
MIYYTYIMRTFKKIKLSQTLKKNRIKMKYIKINGQCY